MDTGQIIHSETFKKHMRLFNPISLITICSLYIGSAKASPFTEKPYPVDYQLIAETDGIVPGETFYLGLYFKHQKGWHTYWKNPGDVGLPPAITWKDIPKDFVTKDVLWAAPEIHKMGIIDVQSYHGEILHIHPIQAPTQMKIGSKITLKGQLSWMMCSKQCVPAWENVSITLPVVKKANPNKRWKHYFSQTRQSQPRILDCEMKAKSKGNHIELTISPALPSPLPKPEDLWFFCNENHITTQSLPTISSNSQGTTLRMLKTEWAPKEISRLQGHLYLKKGWDADGKIQNILVDIPLDSN